MVAKKPTATECHEREEMEKSERAFGVIAQSLSYISSNVYYFWVLSNLGLMNPK